MNNEYFIYLPKSALRSMEKIPLPWQFRIEKAIDSLQFNPYYGEKMSGDFSDMRKIRVWPYRIIYKINKNKKTIFIFEVARRGSVSYD